MSATRNEAGAGSGTRAGSDAVRSSGFFTTDTGWRYEGELTLSNAGAVLEASCALSLPVGGAVDLGGLRHADSAALAVLIALRRRAIGEGVHLTLAGMPQTLRSLADVYGVEALLA